MQREGGRGGRGGQGTSRIGALTGVLESLNLVQDCSFIAPTVRRHLGESKCIHPNPSRAVHQGKYHSILYFPSDTTAK